MRLTRKQLKNLVENYLMEQEEAEAEEESAVPSEDLSDEGGPPVDDAEPPVDDAEPESDDEIIPPDPGADIPKKTPSQPFEIIVDDIKHAVQFIKDKKAGVLKLFIDDTEVKKSRPQDFVTMAGLGMQGNLSDEDIKSLENIVKKTDKSFEKFEKVNDVAKVIQDKMNAERKGFAVADIRAIIDKIRR